MKAWKLSDIGDFEYTDVDIPETGDAEVLVKVMAAGICGSDIPRVYKDGAHNMPLTIGHEFTGEVADTGKGVAKDWKGKRVGIFPLIPCKECIACKQKKYEMCRNYSYLGSRRDGGFAEYVSVPEWNLIELPDLVDYEVAAMLEPMAVATHAMRRINPSPDNTVVIIGLGTIGMFLAMFLRDAGVSNILVVGNKDFQRKKIVKLGIDSNNYCDAKVNDTVSWILDKTNGIGADVIFECVGSAMTYSQAIDAAAPSGQVMLVGNPHSDMALVQKTYWKILRNQLTVYGTWNSSFTHEDTDDWHYVVSRLKNKRINPVQFISHRYSLEDIIYGFEIMRDKREDYIKILAVMD